ncbi:hypothetical protein DICPUDRAFT_75170 [Dictyostelium purpureum]|uniref:EGF-like domain-containing protein n=1 Tax=Dictyostelium purpureum TaxID=5786 RepID=F0Z9V9_DICPU|nr:uncharacterized protein DICPUDRAFT_75170 [Dictyostelium purpureum]EGC39281.1 hypothetical protein DICPUDRAFT_75170 [Dictyostelium purpureum]|eukprot:XP_003284185.1 hypothetical protein DICPUDRAFT_75170 [Dictyostelium purpureum]
MKFLFLFFIVSNFIINPNAQRIQFNFSLVDVSPSGIYSNEKTVLSPDYQSIYFVNRTHITYGDINLSVPADNNQIPVLASSFLFENGRYDVQPILSVISPQRGLVYINNYYYIYQLKPSLQENTRFTFPINIDTKASGVICGTKFFYNHQGFTNGKSEIGHIPAPLSGFADSTGNLLLSKTVYMLTDSSFYLFDAKAIKLISQINDGSSRFTGSLDNTNQIIYLCSKPNGAQSLSLEVISYTKTNVNIVKSVKITDTTLTSCDNSAIDLVQGQLFFSAMDSSSNKFILSMDLNGNNQQIFNLNLPTSTFVNGLNILKTGKINKLLVPSSAGLPLNAYTYKSVCENDCSGNGDCLSMVCNCYEGYGLSDCSQAYPVITSVTGLPYKRPGFITISGDHFRQSDTSVSIEAHPCENVVVIDAKTIKCNFKYDLPNLGYPQPSSGYSVSVSVGTLSTSSNKFKYLAQSLNGQYIQQDNTVTIAGDNIMEFEYQTTIRLNEMDIKSFCSCNISHITCALPENAVNGDFTIIDLYQNSNKVPIKLNPIVTSINPTSIPTSQSKITINGYFFNCEQLASIKIINGELTSGQTGTINSATQIIYNTPNRIVKTTILSLQTSYSISSSVSYTYQDPIITSFLQPSDNNGQLRLMGSNFLNPLDSDLLSISYGNPANSLASSVVSLNFEYIELKLPQDFISTVITLTINGKSVNKFINLKPIINEILPLPSTSGGDVTISGLYLGSKFYLNDNTKLTKCDFKSGNKVICGIPSGSGTFSITSESTNPNDPNESSVKSPDYKMSYIQPTISSITPQGFFSALNSFSITITGKNFIPTKSLVNIFISNNIPCNVDSSSFTQITCSFTSDILIWPSRIPVTVSINSISNTSDSLFYHYVHCPGSPFECSNNGVCDFITGICKCNKGFQLKSDCSASSNPSSTGNNNGITSSDTTSSSGNSNNSSSSGNSNNSSSGNNSGSNSNNGGNSGSGTPNPTSSSSSTLSSNESIDIISASNTIKYSNLLSLIIIFIIFF